MRTIAKNPEPASLKRHRQSGGKYGTYRSRDELLAALVKEQRGLCCYCMTRIPAKDGEARIEHWHSQAHYPGEQLDYANLLAACPGGENKGQTPGPQHCDKHKRDKGLNFNPADPGHAVEKKIFYLDDGTIRSTDEEFDEQINHVLNLNLKTLMNQRKARIDALALWYRSYAHENRQRTPSRRALEKKRDKLTDGSLEKLVPYSPVDVWWLNQRLARKAR